MFRDATPDDREVFIELWTSLLKELETMGGECRPDAETLADVRGLFDSYTQGSLFGVCVLYDPPGEGPQGVALCGEAPGPQAVRSTAWGKVAWGWGIYITPEHRQESIAFHLHANIERKLKTLGFDTVVGHILVENEAGSRSSQAAGSVPHSVIHTCALGER